MRGNSSAETLSDEVLVALIQREDEDALRTLYRRYAGSVLSLARRMGLDQAVGEDCVQEVFQRIWKGARSFDPRKTQARSWLLAIAHHACVDQVRRQAARPKALEPDYGPDGEEEAFDLPGPGLNEEAMLDRLRIRQALARLEPEERSVIEVLYYQGFAHTEAAKQLKIPLGTLKTRARRALEKLQEALGEA